KWPMTASETSHRHAAHWLMQALSLLAFTIILLVLGNRYARGYLPLLAEHGNDEWALPGFYEIECSMTNCYRWSRPDAQIFLYEVDGDYAILSLHMVAPPRGNGVPAKLSIGEPGHMPSTFAVAQMWRRYRIMVPIRATDDTTLYLHSDPYHPAGAD